MLRLVSMDGSAHVIDDDVATLGRDPASTVVVQDSSISRHHARLERHGQAWFVVDEKSANGTFVDGHKVARAELRPGQQLRLGNSVVFTVETGRTADDIAPTMIGAAPEPIARQAPRAQRPAAVTRPATVPAPRAPRPAAVPAPAPVPLPAPAAPAWDEADVDDDEPPRIPCPMCGQPILPAARKCPHCREFLDPKLRAERAGQGMAGTVAQAQADKIRKRVNQTLLTVVVAAVVVASGGLPVILGIVAGLGGIVEGIRARGASRRLGVPAPESTSTIVVVSTLVLIGFTAYFAYLLSRLGHR